MTRQDKTRQDNGCLKNNKCQVNHCKFVGSLYGKGAGYAGALWDKKYLSPTLTTMQGGNREPLILEKV